MPSTKLLEQLQEPYYVSNIIRGDDGRLEDHLEQIGENIKLLRRQLQTLVQSSRSSLTKATSSSAEINEIWTKIDHLLEGLMYGGQELGFWSTQLVSEDDIRDWRLQIDLYEALVKIKLFLESYDAVPAQLLAAEHAVPHSLPQLLHLSCMTCIEMVTQPPGDVPLAEINVLKDKVEQLQRVVDSIHWRLMHDDSMLASLIETHDVNSIKAVLAILLNVRRFDRHEILAKFVYGDIGERIASIKSLEDCLNVVLKPFSQCILKASSLSSAAKQLLSENSVGEADELISLVDVRQQVWQDLAMKITQALKASLATSSNAVTSMTDFHFGLKKLNLAHQLQNNINLLGGLYQKRPKIQLKLSATTGALESYVTQTFIKHYHSLCELHWGPTLEEEVDANPKLEMGSMSKADVAKCYELLTGFVRALEETYCPQMAPLVQVVKRWARVAELIHCRTVRHHNADYLDKHILKPCQLF